MRTLRTHQRRINWLHGKPVVQPAEPPGITQAQAKAAPLIKLVTMFDDVVKSKYYPDTHLFGMDNEVRKHLYWLLTQELTAWRKK